MQAPESFGEAGASNPHVLGLVRAALVEEGCQAGVPGSQEQQGAWEPDPGMQVANTCPEALDRSEGGWRLGEEE